MKIFMKYSRSVPAELIETSEGHKTSVDSSVHHCFDKFTDRLEWHLVIPFASSRKLLEANL